MGNPEFTQNGREAGRAELLQYVTREGKLPSQAWLMNRLRYERAAYVRGYTRAWVDFRALTPPAADRVVEELARPDWLCHQHAWWI